MRNKCIEVGRQCVSPIYPDPVPIDCDRDFDTCALIYISYITVVSEIGIERERSSIAIYGIENIRCVFFSALQFFCRDRFFEPVQIVLFPVFLTVQVLFEDVRVLTRIPSGAVSAVLLNEILSLAEPRIVF